LYLPWKSPLSSTVQLISHRNSHFSGPEIHLSATEKPFILHRKVFQSRKSHLSEKGKPFYLSQKGPLSRTETFLLAEKALFSLKKSTLYVTEKPFFNLKKALYQPQKPLILNREAIYQQRVIEKNFSSNTKGLHPAKKSTLSSTERNPYLLKHSYLIPTLYQYEARTCFM